MNTLGIIKRYLNDRLAANPSHINHKQFPNAKEPEDKWDYSEHHEQNQPAPDGDFKRLYFFNRYDRNFNISIQGNDIKISHWLKGQHIDGHIIDLAHPEALEQLYEFVVHTQ